MPDKTAYVSGAILRNYVVTEVPDILSDPVQHFPYRIFFRILIDSCLLQGRNSFISLQKLYGSVSGWLNEKRAPTYFLSMHKNKLVLLLESSYHIQYHVSFNKIQHSFNCWLHFLVAPIWYGSMGAQVINSCSTGSSRILTTRNCKYPPPGLARLSWARRHVTICNNFFVAGFREEKIGSTLFRFVLFYWNLFDVFLIRAKGLNAGSEINELKLPIYYWNNHWCCI